MQGAIREMTYQWKIAYLVDDNRFRATFGLEPTPGDEAIREAAHALRSPDRT